MARLVEQRNVSLTPAQWAGLEAAAEQTNSRAERGTRAYQFGWRTLLRRIGEGEVLVQEREPYRLPPGLAEAVALEEERQREQERIAEQARIEQERLAERQKVVQRQKRVELHSVQKQAEHKTPPVKLEQLSMLEMEPA